MRDSGPTFVINESGKKLGGIDWVFNAYGGKFPYTEDAKIARNILAMTNATRFGCPLILEGGSIHVDGEGTLLTTEECLLKRNQNLSKEDIEIQLKYFLGVSVIIWLPFGVKYDHDTDGHIDNICCFVKPGEVALTFPSDQSSFQYENSSLALKVLESSVDAKGRKIQVHKLEHPKPLYIQVIFIIFLGNGFIFLKLRYSLF